MLLFAQEKAPVTKWWYVSWKRVGLALLSTLLTVLLVCGTALAVQYQLGPWLAARRMLAVEPELDLTPSALPDADIAILPGERIERFGVSFQLPWKQIDRERAWSSDVVLSSTNGGTIMFQNPSSPPDTGKLIGIFAKVFAWPKSKGAGFQLCPAASRNGSED